MQTILYSAHQTKSKIELNFKNIPIFWIWVLSSNLLVKQNNYFKYGFWYRSYGFLTNFWKMPIFSNYGPNKSYSMVFAISLMDFE